MPALLDTKSEIARLARCLDCGVNLDGRAACAACGRSYPVVGGILEAIGPLSGTNRIAASFYDGPTWPRFKFWENVFLWFQGPGVSRPAESASLFARRPSCPRFGGRDW